MDTELRCPGKWSLNPPARKSLELFQKRAKEFSEFNLNGYPFAVEFNLHDGKLDVDAELPAEPELRVASMAARHFVLEKETTHVPKICNILWKAAEEPFKKAVEVRRQEYLDFWKEKLNGGYSLADEPIDTRGRLIGAFFNGDYFHSDAKYKDFIEFLEQGPGPYLKQQFAQSIYILGTLVSRLNSLVENALGVDQLAPCLSSKRIQGLLTSVGLPPSPIDVIPNPRTRTVYCSFYEVRLPDEHLEKIVSSVIDILIVDHPNFLRYDVTYRKSDGALFSSVVDGQRVSLPPDESA